MNISLNETEQRLVHHIAKLRYEANRASQTSNAKIGSQSDAITDLEGFAAEVAWCKANNCYPDLSTDRGRPTFDAVMHDGTRVDIKATRHAQGKLLATRWKQAAGVDAYCLLVGKFPYYRQVGYMLAQELLQPANLVDLGYGLTYAAEQHRLRPSL